MKYDQLKRGIAYCSAETRYEYPRLRENERFCLTPDGDFLLFSDRVVVKLNEEDKENLNIDCYDISNEYDIKQNTKGYYTYDRVVY